MFSVTSAALLGLPAAQLVSQIAGGVANAGNDFFSALSDKNEVPSPPQDVTQSLESSKQPKPEANQAQPTLADLLKAIQSLIQSLSDDPTDEVTIQSLSDSEIHVTGDEPLASSIQQWTKLHPEWVDGWQKHAAKSQPLMDSAGSTSSQSRLSAAVTSNSVKLNSVDISLLR